MDTQRLILIVALSLVCVMLWDAWQRDYAAPRPEPRPAIPATADNTEEALGLPPVRSQEPGLPGDDRAPATAPAEARLISIETDVLRLKIDQGGAIVAAELPAYPVSLKYPEQPFTLLDQSSRLYHVIQSGIVGSSGPTHKDRFVAARTAYALQDGQDTLQVPLTWQSGDGVSVTRIFELTRGAYLIKLRHIIENGTGSDWQGQQYVQLKRDDPSSREGRTLLYTYTGAVLSSPDNRYEKLSFGDLEDQQTDADIVNGWAAMIQHYFLTALLPDSPQASYRYYTRAFADGLYSIGGISPLLRLGPGEQGELSARLYVGPKVQADLEPLADGLELTVDYGMLWFLAKPLFWCLEKLYELTGNWGWAIILVTVLLKLLFYQLSAAGYRSMAKMRQVQPRLMSIRERYKDDRSGLQQAMMKLYKEEKINPFGGCFPILVQIPVFLALYWVLLESVELRQADFIFWLNDLSSKDPFFVLPIIMGATMLVQQRLNPAPLDPMQEKVMKALPFIFTVFFAFFPSGLVLYWVTNNVLSIAQQWLITRRLEKEGLSTGKSA